MKSALKLIGTIFDTILIGWLLVTGLYLLYKGMYIEAGIILLAQSAISIESILIKHFKL